MNKFEKVAWKSLNKNGSSTKESKSHLMLVGAEKTLCGSALPTEDSASYLSEEYNNGECKRCAKAAEKLRTQEADTSVPAAKKAPTPAKKAAPVAAKVIKKNSAFHDWLAKLTANETLPRGPFFKGKKAVTA